VLTARSTLSSPSKHAQHSSRSSVAALSVMLSSGIRRLAVAPRIVSVGSRGFTSSLVEPLANVPPAAGAQAPANVQVSTVNGLRVATVGTQSPCGYVGAFVRAGSKNETPEDAGAAHWARHLAFMSNPTSTMQQLAKNLESLTGGMIGYHTPEFTAFSAPVLQSNVPEFMPILLNMLRPRCLEYEFNYRHTKVVLDAKDIEKKTASAQAVRSAAYRYAGIGQHVVCPSHRLTEVNSEQVYQHLSLYSPSRTAIVGVGIDHDYLVNSVSDALATSTTIFSEMPTYRAIEEGKSTYVGGEAAVLGSSANTTVTVAYESSSIGGKDLLVNAVLQSALGSGDRYGLNTGRLGQNVVRAIDGITSACVHSEQFETTGLLSVSATGKPGSSSEMAKVLVAQLQDLAAKPLSEEALVGARLSLKRNLLNLCPRETSFRLARRALLDIPTDLSLLQQIDSISAAQVQSAAAALLKSTPTVVTAGDVRGAPTSAQVKSW